MEALFLRILNMSVGAGWLILAAVLFRLVFKNAPKRFRCIVWAIVAVRLICPLTIQSPLSLVPNAAEIPADIIAAPDTAVEKPAAISRTPKQAQAQVVASADSPIIDALLRSEQKDTPQNKLLMSVAQGNLTFASNAAAFLPPHQVTELQPEPVIGENGTSADAEPAAAQKTGIKTFAGVASAVWLSGAALMLVYAAFSYIRLYKKTGGHKLRGGEVIRCDEAETPFILGIFRPRIVIPTGISEYDEYFAVAHEKAHLERRDHLIKPFAFLLLAIHWFNPLMWIGYILLSRDIELACDERVIRKGGAAIKKSYSIALINCSIPASAVSACPIAFGEIGVKARIRSVLNYSKPRWTTVTAALLCCAAIAVFFLPSPVKRNDEASLSDRMEQEQAAAEDEVDYDRFYIQHPYGAQINGDGNTLLSISTAERRYRIDYPDGEAVFGTVSFMKDSLDLTEDGGGRTLSLRRQKYDLLCEAEAEAETGAAEDGQLFELAMVCSAQEYVYMYNGKGCAYYPDTGTLLVYGSFASVLSLLNGDMPLFRAASIGKVRSELSAAFRSDGDPSIYYSSMENAVQLSPLGEA
ncbi:MAG: M56 family metallopeptidase, partial [Clostridia bacterium]|nr:M56 family metallopeptidase [Clostridia bacterium]